LLKAYQNPFLTPVSAVRLGIGIALTDLTYTRQWRGLVESNIRPHGAYFANDWRLLAAPFEKISLYDKPDTGVCLGLISLLSLGLWAAIWGAIASLFSTTL
jgi:hypothetical protein